MADANDTPAVEQTPPADPKAEAAKKSNEQELAKWKDDFSEEQLIVKYKNDEDTKDDKSAGDGDKQGSESSESEEVTGDTEDTSEAPETTYSEPAPVVTTEDPGEFKPQDYSFEIDIKGKTHKVDSAEKAAELAEEFAEDLTAKQLVSLVSKGSSIEGKQERDKDKWEAQKKEFDEQSSAQQERDQAITTMASEFDYLVNKGLLPKIANQYKNADWQDPLVSKQPGVKEQLELVNYMVKENEARNKAGLKPLTSVVDAYNAWQLDENRKKSENDDKQAGEQRKAAGARVAGVSPAAAGQVSSPKGISIGNPNVFKRGAAIWDD
jgi:hypothetical protein